MDAHALSEVMGCSLARARQMLPGYIGAMRAAHITNTNRAAMFAAQIGHESVGLQYMEEIASGAAYEGRRDLGNIYPGDGRRYKGSGPIQLTGRANFRAFTQWANAQGHSSLDFEAQPELVRTDPRWGFLAASWYWVVARPQINPMSDRRDLEGVTRAINGGLNGLADRRRRYNKALSMGARLLPPSGDTVEKRLDYPRDQVHQDTFYNCGPASVQTIVRAATGRLISESQLGRELRTHTGGTDWIGQFPPVLDRHIPGAGYRILEMPHDPPTSAQRDRLWDHVRDSIDAGRGVVANIVAPPSNYPRASYTSTINPAYGGGTVYHYFAVMGYAIDAGGTRHVWVADSGFSPYGYWCTLAQLASLIPPKGYAYPAGAIATNGMEGLFMSLPLERQEDLARKIDRIHHELTYQFQSRYEDPDTGEQSKFTETLVGYILEADRKLESMNAVRLPALQKAVDALTGLFKKEK